MAAFAEIGENPEWFYLDSTSQEFGPFSNETMRDWFTQGFFPIGEELLVRLPTWPQHRPLRQIYEKIGDAFRSVPRANQGALHQGLVDEMAGVPGVPGGPQAFAGCPQYWMQMQPGAPPPYPGAGYGFPPAAARPGGYMPGPPRPGYGMHPVLPQGLGAVTGRYEGRIKSFNAKQGFGFIECPEAHAIFGRDVFLHKAQIGDLKVGTQVTYCVEMNKQGMPQAREITTTDGQVPGPSPANVAKGGGPSGGRGKGGGGKGRGDGGGKNRGRKGGGKGHADGDDGGFGGKGLAAFPAPDAGMPMFDPAQP